MSRATADAVQPIDDDRLPMIVSESCGNRVCWYLRTEIENSHGKLEIADVLLEEYDISRALVAYFCVGDRS